MLDNYLLKGCGTALVTPFNEDQTVDYEAFGRMVTRQIDNGIDFLVPGFHTFQKRFFLFCFP